MLNLTDVTVADGSQPIFEFEANPRLSMTSSLAQFQLNIICKNETTAACYYAQPTPPKTSSAIEIGKRPSFRFGTLNSLNGLLWRERL